ncbi:PREDICTED: CMRF35-like molecule 4 [Capra hircus]|uniref:CMRF35-like molecule 4 n=1 Tax=Capra hircus TaxID=9925 RepID=UPI000847820A|nr:PREDICTED: CMRF35-like molecule 4 [Capra hircus]
MGGRITCLLPALFLLVIPGSSAISGPRAVRGVEQGSLTVRCQYDPGYEPYVKWWCRGADWSSCCFVVKTNLGSEKEVKQGRVSIKDNWKDRSFTVTMEKLRVDDSDTYWCGTERTGVDLGDDVDVTIDPAPTVSISTRATSSANMFTASVAPEENQRQLRVASNVHLSRFYGVDFCTACTVRGSGDTDKEHLLRSSEMETLSLGLGWDGSQCGWHGWPLLGSVHFLVLVFLKVPLFLGMLASGLHRPEASITGETTRRNGRADAFFWA